MVVITIVTVVGFVTACSPSRPELILGSGRVDDTVHICVTDFSASLTYGEPLRLAPGVHGVTLVRADLVGAHRVAILEQAAGRAVLLDDGTHLSVGTSRVADDDPAWNARVPLDGLVLRDDGGEEWSLALALGRTSEGSGGFDAVDLTYDVDGATRVVRGTQSMSFPAVGDVCE